MGSARVGVLDPFLLDRKMVEGHEAHRAAREIIDVVVDAGASILYTKYIESQIIPYHARTFVEELVHDAGWCYLPMPSCDIQPVWDEDLELPQIDEWAVGVLPTRDTAARPLRNSVIPPREVKQVPRRTAPKETPPEIEVKTEVKVPPRSGGRSVSSSREVKPKVKPPPTDAQMIQKIFDDARKRMQVSQNKQFTMDADLTVIQIAEQKQLPPSFVIPKIGVKGKQPPQAKRSEAVERVTSERHVVKKPTKKTAVRLLDPDQPIFDTEITDASFVDRVVVEPGVTLREGGVSKSRQPVLTPGQMTRAAFEAHLEALRKGEV